MANFLKYEPKLKKFEGGFVNDPLDAGGATMRGVTLNTYRKNFGANKTVEDLKNISNSEWRYIMKGQYWDKCKADYINNQSIAELIVDWTVNAGTNGIKGSQAALGLKADGIVGKQSLAAFNAQDSLNVFEKIKSARIDYYKKIVAKKPSQNKFLKGWLNRVNSFKFSELIF